MASFFNPQSRPGEALIYRNDGGTFTEVSAELGLNRPHLPMGANYGDLNNDGWLDFYLGTGEPGLESQVPNAMYLNDRGSALSTSRSPVVSATCRKDMAWHSAISQIHLPARWQRWLLRRIEHAAGSGSRAGRESRPPDHRLARKRHTPGIQQCCRQPRVYRILEGDSELEPVDRQRVTLAGRAVRPPEKKREKPGR